MYQTLLTPYFEIYTQCVKRQCDFSFDLFFSFSFSFASYLSVCKSYTAFTPSIKPAGEDVLMICLNTVRRYIVTDSMPYDRSTRKRCIVC